MAVGIEADLLQCLPLTRELTALISLARRAVARLASEGWWAWQDSNLQPDRYERSQ